MKIKHNHPGPACNFSGISRAGRGLPDVMTSNSSFSLEDKSPFTDMLLVASTDLHNPKDQVFTSVFASVVSSLGLQHESGWESMELG